MYNKPRIQLFNTATSDQNARNKTEKDKKKNTI